MLIAKFYPVKRMESDKWGPSRGTRNISAADKFVVDDGFEVHCPISDGNQHMSFNWTSPFEGAGAESKIPTISALLQSGSLNSFVQSLGGGKIGDGQSSATSGALAAAFGRTGITKLNSTQVFNGMPPVKFQVTLHFRALLDPFEEVEQPIQQLLEWASPQYLANDGLLVSALKNGLSAGVINTVFPSLSPQVIAMEYAGKVYSPLVIDDVNKPLTGPIYSDGSLVNTSIQLTMSTLTAIDRRDIRDLYRRN
ncbi:hypothetical protein [Herbaspirillum sp. NPDC087042]|uniref:hypothetical protein n=1 Tax=Herbaspirillum sp. NPDC087042 TaxID=3364004 RepID=UPI003803612C